jgi:eukaryotic-like serine/threonine-protein kinase
MAKSVPEFWKLVEQSRLLAPPQCQQLDQEFQATNGSTDHASPRALADWLVARNIFSRYQATVLLAGRPGPFVYGDYKIYDRIDAGRLTGDFRAVHAATGHPVLLGFLSGPIVQTPQAWSAAATEAQIACSLVHPHLHRFFELVNLGSFKFLVSEDLHGETLAERLAAGRLPPMEACRLARQLALGLSALHPTGRAHGDVRPVNVWLEPPSAHSPGNARLLRDPLTPPAPLNFTADDPHGWLLAKSDYLAPEFQLPGKVPDVLTDLYALGCTLYHMLAGHPPFPGGSVLQKMARHSTEAIRPLEHYGVPQPLAKLVAFLMAKNPALRYQESQSVADQLAAFIDPAVLHIPPAPLPPTLGPFESSVRQSQALLAARAARETFTVTPGPEPTRSGPSTAAAPGMAAGSAAADVPPPVIRTDIQASLPKGKVVSSAASSGPQIQVAAPSETGKPKLVDPKAPLDPALLAAREAQQRKRLIITLVSVGVAAILLIIGVNMLGRRGATETTENPSPLEPTDLPEVPEIDELRGVQSPFPSDVGSKGSDDTPTASRPPAGGSAVLSGPTYEVVADDGNLPWASPTEGPPIDLTYVPPTAGMFFAVRPVQLLAAPEGPKVLQALGPRFESMLQRWEQAAGVKLGDCERLLVSLHDNDNQFPKVSVVVRLVEAVDPAELPGKWSGVSEQKHNDESYYAGPGWSYYIPASENGKVFLMAAADDIEKVIEQPVQNLKREVEIVRRSSDADRHVTLLYDPTFLFSGHGDPLFADEFARVKEPLKWLLGEGLQASLVSLHFGDTFYAEMRSQTKVDKRSADLAEDFRQRLAQVPEGLTDYFAQALNPPLYWRKLSFRFPSMIEEMHRHLRVGVENDQAVVNVVLPPTAGHNLILGTELAIATAPGQPPTTAVATPGGGAVPKTLEEALNLKIKSFAFDSLPFENAVLDVAAEVREQLGSAPVEFQVLLIGKDLEAAGVTRNKSLTNFNEQNKTVAEVLTALAVKANPSPVQGPADADQVLVWVVGEDPDDKKQKVIFTTRAGAAARGYKLPAVFEAK